MPKLEANGLEYLSEHLTVFQNVLTGPHSAVDKVSGKNASLTADPDRGREFDPGTAQYFRGD